MYEKIIKILENEPNLIHRGINFAFIHNPEKFPLAKEELEEIFKDEYVEKNFDEFVVNKTASTKEKICNRLIETLEKNWGTDDFNVEEISKLIKENLVVVFDKEKYLDQTYQTNIMLDTGDGSYDFTINTIFGSWCTYPNVHKDSSIVWLMRQQGIKMKTIEDYVHNENYKTDDIFLKSVKEECTEVCSDMYALTFLCNMTLREIIKLNKKICWTSENHEIEKMIISKDTKCGLYDPWRGSTEMLNIKLQKNVTVPVKYVFSVKPDGIEGFGIEEHIGECPELWESGKILKYIK